MDTDKLTLRSYHDDSDYEIMADIFNNSCYFDLTSKTTKVTGDPERYKSMCLDNQIYIAEHSRKPGGFSFIRYFGTVKNERWQIYFPITHRDHSTKGIEKNLLRWIMNEAQKENVKSIRAWYSESAEPLLSQLEDFNYQRIESYVRLKAELLTQPTINRFLPENIEINPVTLEESMDELVCVFQQAFPTEVPPISRKTLKDWEKAVPPTLILLCREKTSQEPIAVIWIHDKSIQWADRGGFTIGVIPSFQGQGIGSALIEKAMDYFWQKRITHVQIAANVTNYDALRLYERFGFKKIPGYSMHCIEFKIEN